MAIPVSKVVVDVILCVLVILPFAVLELAANPSTAFQRGFFCNDESIRYPYKEDTISDAVLIVSGVFPNVIAMFIIEWLLYKHCQGDSSSHQPVYTRKDIGSKSLHPYAIALYCTLGPFVFGIATVGLLTDAAKFFIGRLRPHFISVCDPDFSAINCTDPYGDSLYIQDYECRGTDESKLTDARLSFPSGHASYSFFCMVYLAFYLQYRMIWTFSLLLKPFLQLIALTYALMCALSRVSDYKHHPTDVLAGSVLGTTIALCGVIFVSDLFRKRPSRSVNLAQSDSTPDYGTNGSKTNDGYKREMSLASTTTQLDPDDKPQV